MKALLVDDHSLVRHGLDMLLTMRLNFDTVIHAENASQALDALQQQADFNLVLLDYQLGQDNGLDVLTQIKAQHPQLPVAIMSGLENAPSIVRSLGEGAAGFIPKSHTPTELASALEVILAGAIYVPQLPEAQAASQVEAAVNQAQARMAQLAELARRVVREKNYSGRLEADQGCEITSAFNSLLDELQRDRSQLEALAFSDPLTGLANRRLFIDRAQQALQQAQRHSKFMALVYLDLDDFKRLNDQYGHDQGDALLCTIGQRLSGVVRAVDTVARLGGDEFTVVLGDIQSRAELELIIQRMFTQLTQPAALLQPLSWQPSVSMGVAISNGEERLEALMRRADAVMYQVKAQGKNRYLLGD